jgi:hypothetical protein
LPLIGHDHPKPNDLVCEFTLPGQKWRHLDANSFHCFESGRINLGISVSQPKLIQDYGTNDPYISSCSAKLMRLRSNDLNWSKKVFNSIKVGKIFIIITFSLTLGS